MKLGLRTRAFSLVACLTALLTAHSLFADGTEELGAPSIPIAAGTDVLMGGVGLLDSQPGTITLDVPAGVTVQQAILYWQGFAFTADEQGETDTILVNGVPVDGARIGGPTYFFANAFSDVFRADITDLGLVTAGATASIDVSGLDFEQDNNGAGLMVIVDDGTSTALIDVRDGSDAAFYDFDPTIDAVVPQLYTFEPSDQDRTAQLSMFIASVSNERPNVIRVWVDGVLSETLVDALGDTAGDEFDVVVQDVFIPAGATNLEVQLFSEDAGTGPYAGNRPASMVWVTSALRLVETTADCGECQGCVTELTFRYNGNCPAWIKMIKKDKDTGKKKWKKRKGRRGGWVRCNRANFETVFHGVVMPGQEITVTGTNGNLGEKLFVRANWHCFRLKTDCSYHVGPGLNLGPLEIIGGTSELGGELCPVDCP